MRIALTSYEYYKLQALINGLCLSLLFMLYVFLIKSEIPSMFVLLIAVPIDIILSMLVAFILTSVFERIARGKLEVVNVRHMAISVCFPLACILAGVIAIAIFQNSNIASLMIIVLSGYFGFYLGRLVKFRFRYKLE